MTINHSVLHTLHDTLSTLKGLLAAGSLEEAAALLPKLTSAAHEAAGALQVILAGRQTNFSTYCAVVSNTLIGLRSVAQDEGCAPEDFAKIKAQRLAPVIEALTLYQDTLLSKYAKALKQRQQEESAAPSMASKKSLFFSLHDAFAQAAKDLNISLAKKDLDLQGVDAPGMSAFLFDFEALRTDTQTALRHALRALHNGDGDPYKVVRVPLAVSFTEASTSGLQALQALKVAGCYIVKNPILIAYSESRGGLPQEEQRNLILQKVKRAYTNCVDVLDDAKSGVPRVLRAKGFAGAGFLWVLDGETHAALSPYTLTSVGFAL
jgi:hypothetical protein